MTDIAMPLDIGDVVQVTNNDDTPLVLEYDSRRHVIQPHETRPVPFECANVYFGDPRSSGMIASKRDNVGRVQFIPDRATEVRRLRTLYDNQMGDERFILNHPNVTVKDYDGHPVLTVLDDPSGESVTVAQPTISENEQLRHLINRQQQTIDMLAQRLGVDPQSGRDVSGTAPADDEFATEPAVEDPAAAATDTTPEPLPEDA